MSHLTLRRVLGSALLLGVAFAVNGCADAGPIPTAPPGTEGALCDLNGCGEGLDCLASVCVAPCSSAIDCGGRQCLPSPTGQGGWCALNPDEATPGGEPPSPEGTPSPGADEEGLEKPPLGDPQPPADEGPEQPEGKRPGGESPDEQGPDQEGPERVPDPPEEDQPDETPPHETPPGEAPPGERVPDDEAPAPEVPWEDSPDAPADPPADAPPPPAPCRYPTGLPAIGMGQLMPNLSWTGVYDGQGNRVDFDLEGFHCDGAYDQYSILVVVVGAEWCGACSQYLSQLRGSAAAATQAGALFLYVEVEDNSYSPASHEVARRVVDRHAPGIPGLRIGDGQTRQGAGTIANSPMVRQYPTMFAVRRADMRIIREGRVNWGQLAQQEMLANPPGAPGPSPDQGGGPPAPNPDVAPPAGCQEEAAEPNDAAQQAATLSSGQVINGGVCNGTADFYRVDHPGFWSLELEFSHAEGDLDVYVWDPIRNAPAVGLDGNAVGSDSATDDELVVYAGPQVVMITGYQGARASYRLSLQGF